MPKFSGEGRLGLLMEIVVIILEQLHVTAGYVIWPLFGLGALLIADWVWRGEWKQKHSERAVKTRLAIYSILSLTCLSILAVRLVYRIRYIEKSPTEDSIKNIPQPQTPPEKASKEPVPTETPTVKPVPSAKPQKHQPIVKSNPIQASSVQNCPNGNCIGGDNNGTAIVNNGPPEPNVQFVASKSVETANHRYVTMVQITADQDIKDFTFSLEFDNTVYSPEVELSYASGFVMSSTLKASAGSSKPGNVFEATIRTPIVFPKGERVTVKVYSPAFGPINFLRGIKY